MMKRIAEKLEQVRSQFGRSPRREKRRLLAKMARQTIGDAKLLRRYHDTLLFMAAYPDDADILRRVKAELRRVGETARRVEKHGPRREAARLIDSGIANTLVQAGFSIDIAAWLARRSGQNVEIDWEDEEAGEHIESALPMLASTVERDGLMDDRLTTKQWIRLARGGRGNDLGWLVARWRHMGHHEELSEWAFDKLGLNFQLRIRRVGSRTLNRFPARRIAYQTGPIEKAVDLRALLAMATPRVRPLGRLAAERLLDICRWTLVARRREIDTLSYVNPREVYLFNLERGIDIAVFGMRPKRRLPIESYFGFVAAKNRVPIGYGGGWVFGDTSEIGVNIFDEFRGGESAYAFAQVLRVFCRHFGPTRFTVDPYQFGEGNPEAIRSGAFWFYYRLGFRPTETGLAALAEEEFARIRSDRAYRSSASVLRRLARGKIEFDAGGGGVARVKDANLSELGLAVTRRRGKEFARRGGKLEDAPVEYVAGTLEAGMWTCWPSDERESFKNLCSLVVNIPRVGDWSRPEKRALVAVMRAKGGELERTYVRRLQAHTKLRAAMNQMAKEGRQILPNSRSK